MIKASVATKMHLIQAISNVGHVFLSAMVELRREQELVEMVTLEWPLVELHQLFCSMDPFLAALASPLPPFSGLKIAYNSWVAIFLQKMPRPDTLFLL